MGMKIQTFLDDALFESEGVCPSIGHVVEAARLRCQAGGRVLVEILLNDEAVTSEELSMPIGGGGGLSDATEEGIDRLRMYSADPFDLVVEAAMGATDAIGRIEALQSEVAEMIQSGYTGESMPKLLELMEVWQQVQQCVDEGGSLIGIDVGDFRAADDVVDDSIRALTAQLTVMREALTNGDWVVLSDCLAYEMGAVADQWRQLLDAFMEQVEVKRAARLAG